MAIDVVSFGTILGGALAAAVAVLLLQALVLERRGHRVRKELQEAQRLMQGKDEVIQSVVNRALKLENDNPRMAFIRLMVEMESGLRQVGMKMGIETEKVQLNRLMSTLADKGIVTEKLNSAFRDVWEIRNKAVHGLDISAQEFDIGLPLLAMLLLAFKEAWPNWFQI